MRSAIRSLGRRLSGLGRIRKLRWTESGVSLQERVAVAGLRVLRLDMLILPPNHALGSRSVRANLSFRSGGREMDAGQLGAVRIQTWSNKLGVGSRVFGATSCVSKMAEESCRGVVRNLGSRRRPGVVQRRRVMASLGRKLSTPGRASWCRVGASGLGLGGGAGPGWGECSPDRESMSVFAFALAVASASGAPAGRSAELSLLLLLLLLLPLSRPVLNRDKRSSCPVRSAEVRRTRSDD
jgi:hypothetical protein